MRWDGSLSFRVDDPCEICNKNLTSGSHFPSSFLFFFFFLSWTGLIILIVAYIHDVNKDENSFLSALSLSESRLYR